MKYKIFIHKAQGSINDLSLKAEKELPIFNNINLSYQFFKNDAEDIFNALMACLPGGTIDQLLLLLLTYKASQFVVPYGKFKGGK